MSIQEAFFKVCKEAKPTGRWYVTLMCESSYYGGPEEGGWWGHDTEPVAYQEFATEDEAAWAAERVQEVADAMTEEAKRLDGEYCKASMEWLDNRGLDADYLPEPDGPDKYRVCISEEIPQGSRGPRHYE